MVNVKDYLGEVVKEMRKVSWPSRKELISNTVVTIFATAALSLFERCFEPGIPCHCDRRARERKSRARRHSRRARDLGGVGSPEGSGLLGRRPAARKEVGAAEAA